MAIWVSAWGNEFEKEEAAREDAREHMDWDSYKEELQYTITFDQLLDWAHEQESFFDAFQEEISDAEGEFFLNNYTVEQALFAPLILC